MLSDLFDHLAQQASLTLNATQKQQLIGYVELLNKWNRAYNLTSVRAPEQMLVRHIFDSLVVGEHLQGQYFIDVGTGPGLPGIPLAILKPDCEFTLVDSLGKRVKFMRQVCFELGIKNVTPIQSRIEQFDPGAGFDGVLSRAFASIHDMLSWCHHLPNSAGRFYALKGAVPDDELAELPQNIETKIQLQLEAVIQLTVPQREEQRHLIIIK